MSTANEKILEGKYALKDDFGSPVAPEHFLSLFQDGPYFGNVAKFVRRVDNDTGIPFLLRSEYEHAKEVIPEGFLEFYEDMIVSPTDTRIYLRGKNYYLNFQDPVQDDGLSHAEFSLRLLLENVSLDLKLNSVIQEAFQKSDSLEERMVVGSLVDLYKNHLLVLFTGLYESMKLDKDISVEQYRAVLDEAFRTVGSYYNLIISGECPAKLMSQDEILPVFGSVEDVIRKTKSVYDGRRYLSREFDHPGRMLLYASHLLSQIREKGEKYDLTVNLLNGSAEIGMAVKKIDDLLCLGRIGDTVIYDVDFARYSRKDRLDKDIASYSDFESIAVPQQLHNEFRTKVKGKKTLLVDDNLNTGQSLYNVRLALRELARTVDLSVVEVVPLQRVVELIRENSPEVDPHNMIKLIEPNLTYSPIGWWRDQVEMIEEKRVQETLGWTLNGNV